MAISFFKKSKVADAAAGQAPEFKRDQRKARSWFDRARAVADTGQHDYAIECYINGLKFDPDAMAAHEGLREVALKRKVKGGKSAGLQERFLSGGKSALEKMLHNEAVWSKDALNAPLILPVMKQAVATQSEHPDLSMEEVVDWLGGLLLEQGQSQKKLSKANFIEARDYLAEVGDYERAIEACKRAVQVTPDDAPLLQDLKNLEAEWSMQKANYAGAARDSVKDTEHQKTLEDEQRLVKTESILENMIKTRRAEYEETPEDPSKLSRLIDALLESGTPEAVAEAMRVLREVWEQTGQYRHKVRMGDIQIRQFKRELREYGAHLKANPNDETTRRIMADTVRKELAFELGEYQERVKNYPTDMGFRYHLGVRLYLTKQFDEAIAEFQQARADPKHRGASMLYLGKCYNAKGWFDEAVDALRQGIASREIVDDRIGLDLRYDLMEALESLGEKNKSLVHAREAQKIASEILQANINYRDIRQRIEKIRKLVDSLQG
ncbi:MAG: tetratricopeptide repeat protein [Phycisphaeraceae bacterium]